MAIPLTNLQLLHEYLNGIMDRADHHAMSVNEIALAIAGAVAWRCDSMHAFEREGEMKNVLRFFIGDLKYTLTYDHAAGEIILKEGSIQGHTIARFNNITPVADIKRIFQGL